jgi:DNA-directed RNA polymerase specialized sigma24 family protein
MIRERYWFDIEDPEGFVKSFMPKVRLTPERREELFCEGMGILTKMRNDYRPGHGGGDPATSCFSGYAASYLPRKIRDAWHRLEGHTLTTGEKGKREWEYHDTPSSLEAMTTANGSDKGAENNVQALRTEDIYDEDMAQKLGDALDRMYAEERKQTIGVGLILGEGGSAAEAATRLGLRSQEVALAVSRIRRAIPLLTTLEAA